jgi:hypothetical protein
MGKKDAWVFSFNVDGWVSNPGIFFDSFGSGRDFSAWVARIITPLGEVREGEVPTAWDPEVSGSDPQGMHKKSDHS